MAEYTGALIAFWDGESKGTKHIMDLAKRYELKVKVAAFPIPFEAVPQLLLADFEELLPGL